jgi:hypothetical protein
MTAQSPAVFLPNNKTAERVFGFLTVITEEAAKIRDTFNLSR